MHRAKRMALMAAMIGMAAGAAVAGPPLLCFPYQCDETVQLADSEKKPGKDLPQRVVASLDAAKTTLGRMETIRRGAMSVGRDSEQSRRVHERLMARALDAIASQKDAAGALFDAGLWAATTTQAGATLEGAPGKVDGVIGIAWVERAIEMDPTDAAKAFGAAVMLADRDSSRARPYLARAVAGAEPGSALARSIESNLLFGGKKIEALRKELADAPRAGK